MKQLLVLSLTCLLISSCGLFKKTTKTSSSKKQIENVEVQFQSNEEVNVEVGGEVSVKYIEQKQIQKNIDDNTSLTADEIEIISNGSIKGKGNAKLVNNRKDRSKSDQNIILDSTNSYIGHIDAKKENKSQSKKGNSSLQIEAKTSTTSDFNNILRFLLCIVGLVGIIILYKKIIKNNIFTKIFTKLKL